MNGERQMGRRTRDVGVGKGLWSARRMGMVAFRCFDPEKRTSSQCLGAIRKKKWPPKLRIGGCVYLAGSSTFNESQRVHWRGKLEDSTRTKIISPTPRPRPRPP